VPIVVEIEYVQVVPKVDFAYELVVPMVVGPRFQPVGAGVSPEPEVPGETPRFGRWVLEALPGYPPAAGVNLPEHIVGERVSMLVDLETPVPLASVTSDTHPLDVRHVSSTQRRVRFAAGRVLDNRDFVLRYTLAAETEVAGVLSHWEAGEGGYFSLLIEPPAEVGDERALPREMVFLLDCSGSMNGAPMDASKRFMSQALRTLRPTDTFRIIRFSDSATEFSARPLAATPANVQRGLVYTSELQGSGGTMMTSGVRQALATSVPEGAVRNVIFLTDGYIGNEVSVLELVQELLGHARLYAFGVGAGVNRYLLDELGRVGRGFTRYFDPTRDEETQETVVTELVTRLQSPVLTDLSIDWGALPVSDVVPARLPDLYAGDSIRVTGRFSMPAAGRVSIRGTGRRQRAELVTSMVLSEAGHRPAVRRVWARNTVAELMHAFVTPPEQRPDGMNDQQLQAAVTRLGLGYGIATRWTSFVAVSRRIYNPNPGAAADADVAVPQVAGVSTLAYTGPTMSGGAAPEPGIWLGLLTSLLVWLTAGRRKSRRHVRSSDAGRVDIPRRGV
jgi:Ca-activated chloride channel family protein